MRTRGLKKRWINVAVAFVLFLTAQDSKGLQMPKEGQWGDKAGGLAVSISVPEGSFKASDDAMLNIILKDFGTMPVSLVVRSSWVDYTYLVRNSHGQEMTMNEHGRQRAEAALEGRKILRDLQPGESRSEDFEVSKAFDLEPDTYIVVVTRTFPRPERRGEFFTAQSNEVTFQISK